MQPLRPRLGDAFSFELPFTLFLFAATYKSMPVLKGLLGNVDLTVAIVILSVALGMGRILRQGIYCTRSSQKLLIVWFVFLMYITLSYLIGKQSPYSNYKMLQTWLFSSWAIFAATFVITKKEHFERFYRLILAFAVFCAVYSSLYGVVQGSVGLGAFGGQSYQWLGITVATGVLLAIVAMLSTRNVLVQLVMGAATAIMVLAVVLSALRQAMVGLIMALLFLGMLSGKLTQMIRTNIKLAFVLLIVTVSSFILIAYWMPEHNMSRQITRLTALFSAEHRMEVVEGSSRLDLWKDGISVWLQHPVVGVGIGAYPQCSERGSLYPHNLFIELLAEFGVIGFLLGAIVIGMPAWILMRQRTKGLDWMALGFASLCGCCGSFVRW